MKHRTNERRRSLLIRLASRLGTLLLRRKLNAIFLVVACLFTFWLVKTGLMIWGIRLLWNGIVAMITNILFESKVIALIAFFNLVQLDQVEK